MTDDPDALAGELPAGVRIRNLRESDAERLGAAYQRNHDHLAPWEPVRAPEFYTPEGQGANIRGKLGMFAAGTGVPWIMLADGRAVGAMTLSGIVRGPFLSANLGYWVDRDYNGQGVGTAAVAHVLDAARTALGLHRIQAATLPHNTASQTVLRRSGFQEIGLAPDYLRIAGTWQDHVLFQRILHPPVQGSNRD
ncbi:GNAT family N-acetyltransferase [Arthrobacter sp. Hor0625]|uniref:GNAT family N-acetyltransferase n=1 Tax=Arthrobacter sp. Hor0625 TaxID=3457358 RepID=UPI00403E8171